MQTTDESNQAAIPQLDPAHLPRPRLEFRWEPITDGMHNYKCTYSLVFPLGEYDIRRGDKDEPEYRSEMSLEIGTTLSQMGSEYGPIYDGEVVTPYRDGAHAQWDRKTLGSFLPIVAICGDVATLVEILG